MLDQPSVHTVAPLDFIPVIHVASCCCTFQGRLLLLQNAPKKTLAGTWGVPGGKLEPSEIPLAAAMRETFEETGIQLKEKDVHFFATFYVRYPGFDFVYHLFSTQLLTAPQEIFLKPREHSAYLWVTPQEILQLALIPGTYDCLVRLYGNPLHFP